MTSHGQRVRQTLLAAGAALLLLGGCAADQPADKPAASPGGKASASANDSASPSSPSDTASPIGVDGAILWPGPQNTLYALDRKGALLWQEQFDGQVLSPAVGKGGRVYVADMSGTLVALDVRGASHQKAWTTSVGGSNYASPPVVRSNGQGAFGDNPGRVWVLDAKTGRVERKNSPAAASRESVWTSVVIDAREHLLGHHRRPALRLRRAGPAAVHDEARRPGMVLPFPGADETRYIGTTAGTLYAITGWQPRSKPSDKVNLPARV